LVSPFVQFLWKHRKPNIIAFFIMMVISMVVVFGVMDKYYTSDVTVLPPGGGDIGSNLNTIASIVGMGNLSTGMVSLEMFQSVIISRKLEKKLLETHFDVDPGGEFEFSGKLIDFLKIDSKNQRDLYEQAYKTLNEDVIYAETDDISNILKIGVSLQNPYLSKEVAETIVKYLDEIVKKHVNKEFFEQYTYIKKRIAGISDTLKFVEGGLKEFLEQATDLTIPRNIIRKIQLERKLTILSTILGELKKQEELFVMQNMSMISPVKVLDNPVVPFKKSRPKRILVLLAFIMIFSALQLMANAAIIFFRKFHEALNEGLKHGSTS